MFDDVPEPVWNTSIGNWSSWAPPTTSSAAATIASFIGRSSWFTRAASALINAERVHERRRDGPARNGEVLDRALGLRAPEGLGRHTHLAHRVVLDAVAGLGHEILLAARYFLVMPEFAYQELLPIGADDTPYQLLTSDYVSTFTAGGRRFVQVEPEALTLLTSRAMFDIAHLLRPGHLAQLSAILDDPEASPNDRFVAMELLKNACIAAGGILPSCQDTGTAIVKGKKGELVVTGGGDREAISRGIFRTYNEDNLRYSQLAPLTAYEEKNTGTNLPAEIEIESVDGDAYKLLFMAKGGGSANKSLLFQETKALLNPIVVDELARREAPHARYRRVPAVPPRARHRRHVGRVRVEDRQARVGALPRHASRNRQRARSRLSRPRARTAGARPHPGVRHRRAVRR